uniref:VL-SARAH(S37C)chimera n=1 Tax=Homo sapiens TaxID=9606 RepID=UPI000BBD4991|nr:Chain B, VL-SARAH(S37C)chimera [synthetic construct]
MGQTVVTQESALTTSPGETVTLTCRSSTGAVTTSNYANWVQEKPDHLFTGLIVGTNNRVPGVPPRFSGSLIEDKAALTITGAQTEDEAIYFCALWYSNHWVFGGGTKLTVLGGSDYEFLKSWTVEDLQKRLLALDPMMEQEIEEIRQKYQCKRQPILDAIEAK